MAAAVLVGAAVVPLHAQLVPLVVRGVHFKGNHGVDPDFLASTIATTESPFFARSALVRWMGLGQKRYFNENDFRGDVLRLQIVFKRSGYPNVQVDTIVKRSPGAIDVTFVIKEGPPVYLQSLQITGLDSVANAWQVRQDLPIAPGDVASDYLLHVTQDTVQQRLRNRGYPAATVTYEEGQGHVVQPHAQFAAHPGQFAHFGAIRVNAADDVDTAFASSLITARPGNLYQVKEIAESQRALYLSDLYRFATVDIDTTRYTLADTTVPLLVSVVNNDGHRAKASVGYGTDDCFRLGAGWTARNFPGSGLVFDVTGQLSKIGVGDPLAFGLQKNVCSQLRNDSIGSRLANYALNASLRRNAFLSPENAVTLSVFGTRRSEFEVYLRQEIGAAVSVTRATAADVPVTLTYRIADGTTKANPASFCAFFNTCEPDAIAALQQRRVEATLSFSALRERVNNPLDPLRGSVLSASATVSSRFLGSSQTEQFVRFIADASDYFPATRAIVVATHIRAGLILAPNIAVGGESGNFVPPDERFYAGGSNDVRGYDQNELGPLVYVVPVDSIAAGSVPNSATRVSPIGGTRVGVGNLELRFPTPVFGGRLRAVTFLDAGTLWNAGQTPTVRFTPGVGLRYNSPLGPIRLDLGYNPYSLQSGPLFAISSDGTLQLLQQSFSKSQAQHWTLHFAVGQAF